jgi:GNAT superfamily N-acetyltransferase
MRLLVVVDNEWSGGIVLGSTFANVHVRDDALDLKQFVRGHQLRGLRSPWAAENTEYWSRLQLVVNHARTFVFPEFQGKGIGIAAHRELLRSGIRQWRDRYGRVAALDTLCDSADSGLFKRNGWSFAGETSGYGSDRAEAFIKVEDEDRAPTNNVALRRTGKQWQVWVRRLEPFD